MAQKSAIFGRYSPDEMKEQLELLVGALTKSVSDASDSGAKQAQGTAHRAFEYDFVNHNARIAVGVGVGKKMYQRYADVPDALRASRSALLAHLEAAAPYPVTLFGNRLIAHFNEDFTFKIAINSFGRAENKREQSIWQAASPDLRVLLTPVVSSAVDGSWTIMPYAAPTHPDGSAVRVDDDTLSELRDLGLNSVCDLKDPRMWGVYDNFTVLTTYCL